MKAWINFKNPQDYRPKTKVGLLLIIDRNDLGKKMSSKKGSIFDAIDTLEDEDAQFAKDHQRITKRDQRRTKAAKSQVALYQKMMEIRILLQRVSQIQERDKGDDSSKELCQELLKKLIESRCKLRRKDCSSAVSEKVIASEYEDCREEWKEVLNRRSKDLRLHSGSSAKAQFKLLHSDFWEQVQSVTAYAKTKDFDDSKLYQNQLSDFLLGKQNETEVGPMNRQRKKKKNSAGIDRKASKGRKIRYAVIPKLANFTFPVERSSTNNSVLSEDDLFSSLFGGQHRSLSR